MEDLQPYACREKHSEKTEGKIEVVSAFCASVLISRTSYSPRTKPPEPEDRDGEQNKVPIIQEERVSDLLHHLDRQKSVGPDMIHPRVLRELVEVLIEVLSIIYQQSWLSGEVPLAGHCDIHPQEEQEGGSR